MSIIDQLHRKEYIGRRPEKDMLLHATDLIVSDPVCWAVYFTAGGGLGKTHLLEYYPELVNSRYPHLRIAQTIDMYDPENRSPTELERKLIEGLKHAYGAEGHPSAQIDDAFYDYRIAIENYRRARDTARYDQEQWEATLRQTFISCWNTLSEQHPLVIRFDTVELLFVYDAPPQALVNFVFDPSTPALTQARLVASGSRMLVGWFQAVLPELKHTLALFCGRPPQLAAAATTDAPGAEPEDTLRDTLRAAGVLYGDRAHELEEFTAPEDLHAYLVEYGAAVDWERIPYIGAITGGRPLLLSCYAENWRDQQEPREETVRNRVEFENWLIDTILNPIGLFDHKDRQRLARALCFYFLAYARRGLYRDELRQIFGLPEVTALLMLKPEEYEPVIDELRYQPLIKRVYDAQPSFELISPGDADPVLLLIHDELFQLIDSSGKVDRLGLRTPVLDFLCRDSKAKVRRAGGRAPLLLSMMLDHMYYELTRSFSDGYMTYTVYMDRLLRQRSVEEAMVLADLFWRTYSFRVWRDNQAVYPYRDALAEADETNLSLNGILDDERVRRIKLLYALNRYDRALLEARRLRRELTLNSGGVPRVLDPAEQHADREAYLWVDLLLAQATVLSQYRPVGEEEEEIEDLFEQAIEFLNQLTFNNQIDRLLWLRRSYFLGQGHTLRGQVLRAQQRFDAAAGAADQGRKAFQAYWKTPIQQPGGGPALVLAMDELNDDIRSDLAQATNNLAFNLAESGEFERALTLSRQVEYEYLDDAPPYRQALFLNVRALIEIRRGEWRRAEPYARRAEQAAEASGAVRARGLTRWTRGLIERARMKQSARPERTIGDDYFAEAFKWLHGENDNQRQLLMDWARYARDMALLSRERGETAQAMFYYDEGHTKLDAALELLNKTGALTASSQMQRADLLETRASLYGNAGQFAEAGSALRQAEALLGGPAVEMPAYAQVVCGKVALQWGYVQLFHAQQLEAAMRLFTVALARAYVFAPQHHDQISFQERIIRWTAPYTEARQRFTRRLIREELEVGVQDLRYQRPPDAAWRTAWLRSIDFFANTFEEQSL